MLIKFTDFLFQQSKQNIKKKKEVPYVPSNPIQKKTSPFFQLTKTVNFQNLALKRKK